MNTRDFVIYFSECPDIEVERDVLSPQEVLILIEGKYYEVKKPWVRGDNKLIIEALKKQ